ncbi:MAG: TOBE domain-containing protein [Polaromonas sp.]|nr:TOBE domain-containing protein [Polaromonas sp.]
MKKSQLQLADALGQQSTDKRVDILRRIGQVGSISEAARGAGVSYKAAWQAIDTLSNLAGVALLEKLVGGAGGGGARLTSAGQRVLDAADQMSQARRDVLKKIETDLQLGASVSNLSALSLRTSMRNQLPCKVKAIKSRAGAMRVELLLSDQTVLSARITQESAELLGLKPGLAVLALCKATAVSVGSCFDSADGRNLLTGRVSRASRSKNGGEVALSLPSGLQLVGFTASGVLLKVGHTAMAWFDESAVVIALTH